LQQPAQRVLKVADQILKAATTQTEASTQDGRSLRSYDFMSFGGARVQASSHALCVMIIALSLGGFDLNAHQPTNETPPIGEKAVLWHQRDVATCNLFYGAGGEEHAPAGRFTFVQEDIGGTQPKFDIEDERGIRWTAKLGVEARSETAATRLVWAIGYFTDEDYYVPELRVEGLRHLKRGREYVSGDGVVRGARLERQIPGEKKAGHWSWLENPFLGTREFNGLKVLMALINDWDLKEVNNSIYDEQEGEQRYTVSDLGASFGRNSNEYARSKADVDGYRRSRFIKAIRPQEVDFVLQQHPFWVKAVRTVHFREYGRMEQLVQHIPRTDVRWVGQLLAQLSDTQIGDAFRGAGFSAQEVDAYTAAIKARIAQLSAL
jgi:hypothetical protein